MKKHSMQRDAVYSTVASVKTHPTASEVFDIVRRSIPKISLATVYRNLTDLIAEGKLIAINTEDGVTHFDAFTENHSHLLCAECGSLVDINFPINIDTSSATDCKIEKYELLFYGKCADCLKS